MENVNFVAIDFETATSSYTACQLGIVVVRSGEIVEEKSFLIQPPKNKYSPYNIKIHGIKPVQTKDAPTFGELWDEIRPYFEKQVIVHHSDGFDRLVLEKSLEYYSLGSCRYMSEVSTMFLFSNSYSRSLRNLCIAYNIEMENHHDALSDARNCAQILLKYLSGLNPDYNILPKRDSVKRKTTNFFTANFEDRKISSDTLIQDLASVENTNTLFYDKKIVMSGTFQRYPVRDDLAKHLKCFGANINTALSKLTHLFIVGDKCGPAKMKQAETLISEGTSLRIILEDELYKILDELKN